MACRGKWPCCRFNGLNYGVAAPPVSAAVVPFGAGTLLTFEGQPGCMAVTWVNIRHPRAKMAPLRPTVFVVVVALHLALLLASSRTMHMAGSTEHPLELMFLAPVKTPKVFVDSTRPQRVSTHIAVSLAPPSLNSSLQTGPSSAPDGHGSTVNWTAEAHRAVRAYEIRRDQSPDNSAISVSSSLDERGSREHHAGDQLKTASGDWIVWINAHCYQVASWHSDATPSGPISSQTICRNPRTTPRGD
jgi:hypothetical protein